MNRAERERRTSIQTHFYIVGGRFHHIVLNPAQAGEPLNNFGYPYAEVDGEAVDFYSPDSFAYAILFAEDK